jgi:hypothetical protein
MPSSKFSSLMAIKHTFYVTSDFMSKKEEADYVWASYKLKTTIGKELILVMLVI